MKINMLLGILLVAPSLVHASDFICGGTGAYSAVGRQKVSFDLNKSSTIPLAAIGTSKISASVDASNNDGKPYLSIEIRTYDPKNGAPVSSRKAKGSAKDMVMYSDFENVESSTINCLPIPN